MINKWTTKKIDQCRQKNLSKKLVNKENIEIIKLP